MEKKIKKSQKNRIVQFLEANPGSTNLEIATALRISSSSKRLSELMQMGIVESVRCEEINANGDVSRFCRYYVRNVA